MRTLIKKIAAFFNLVPYYRTYKKIAADKISAGEFENDRKLFRDSARKTTQRFNESETRLWPIMTDKTSTTDFEPHYLYHPAWAARILAKTRPDKHIDISSALIFPAMVSAFLPVEFYDYRPADVKLSDLTCKKADLLNLPFADNSIYSLSCMHTIEHVGLGRYGDEIDYDGDLKAAKELKRVLAEGGNLIMVTPVGAPRIEYNAHRIYAYKQVVDMFYPLELVEFALVPDDYKQFGLINTDEETADKQQWGCGCFWFKKVKAE
ncbi:MAG TPA: class I SAM-dependent methyltransferase [Mucilaginibacter sp.]|jgi:SAM-dependent methyltransferase|nr:class I SAM-dependent methyltransferase [Mucilaginibacter sp.]